MSEGRARMVDRLRHAAADFRLNSSRQPSHAALVREYLRRMALWAEALRCEGEWPFFDVAAVIEGGRTTGAIDPDLQFAPLPGLGGAFRAALAAAVHFAEIAERPEARMHGLPDPYEPLIRLFERGGTMATEHGMIYTGTVGFPRKPFQPATGPALVAFDDATLDALDRERG